MLAQESAKSSFNWPVTLLFLVIFTVIIASFQNLTGWPRIFYDEGITIEIANNFRQFGVLDISTAPGKFTDIPYVTGSNGFPVTLPLALHFKLFGFGLYQARIFALIWLVIFLITVYLFTKRFWGTTNALSALLLVATFAPVYDNGRRVLGEIPGFVFLLIGFLFLLAKKKPLISGIFFGLAMVSKPSVYLLVAPALVASAIFLDRDLRKQILKVVLGMIPALVVWVALAFPNPLSLATWKKIILFYQNPAASTSLFQNITNNLSLFLSHTTLIYFVLISIGIVLVIKTTKEKVRSNPMIAFLIPYVIFQILYFLKSPGWLKYLLPLELMILLILPVYVKAGLDKIGKKEYFRTVIVAIILVQFVQLMFFSNITNATSEPQEIARFLIEREGMIGIINSPHIAGLVPAERKFHYLTQNDQVIIGENPLDLALEELPKFLVMPGDFENSRPFSEDQKEKLSYYELIREGQWKVFELRK